MVIIIDKTILLPSIIWCLKVLLAKIFITIIDSKLSN